jgi:hypothetical protein
MCPTMLVLGASLWDRKTDLKYVTSSKTVDIFWETVQLWRYDLIGVHLVLTLLIILEARYYFQISDEKMVSKGL